MAINGVPRGAALIGTPTAGSPAAMASRSWRSRTRSRILAIVAFEVGSGASANWMGNRGAARAIPWLYQRVIRNPG
jgi:hypothetical protein